VVHTAYNLLSAYGLELTVWFGWPGIAAGGLLGVAVFPNWRISAGLTGAAVGGLLWMSCWLAVALSLRSIAVAGI